MDSAERESVLELERAGWENAIQLLWPTIFSKPMADFQKRAWTWASKIMPEEPSEGYITIWARGASKSTNAEAITAYLAITRRRNYGWYVSSTQQAADDHVVSIADLLTAKKVKEYFPSIASPNVDKEGTKEAWRHNRLITQDGFALDAVGLDIAIRGRRIGDQRPDFIVLDDIDDQYDTPEATVKKTNAIAKGIIPAGTPHVVVLGAQNVITPTGIFASFANRTHTILTNATIDGPIPAIYDLKTSGGKIVGGTPSWPQVLGLPQCQHLIDQIGLNAFLLECQHDVHQTEGALWTRKMIHYSDLPKKIDEFNIGIDPAMSDGPRADLTGIYVAALSGENIYLVDEKSGRWHPSRTKQLAYDLFWKYNCEVHIETDNGGEWLVDALVEMGIPRSRVIGEKSGGVSKRGRAQPLADKSSEIPEDNRLWLCKKFETLENQMVSWVPAVGAKSPDHLDAATWATAKWLKPKVMPMRGYSHAWAG